jgi:peptidoglycan/LPS O-acetylase OafA/YrhL
MKTSARHIDLLDYIRGVAILSILLFHTLGTTFGYDSLPWDGCIRDLSGQTSFLFFLPLSIGQVGVAIFFVVSGFCIHLSFQQQGQKWGGFFIRRFFRIYPPFLAAVIFFILIDLVHSQFRFGGQEWTQLFTHLFLVHNFNSETFFGVNPSFWSLAIEAQLYLIYPVLLFLVGKLGWRRTMAILAVCEFLIRATDGVMQATNTTNIVSSCLSNSPLGYWFSWSLGAYIAEALLKKESLPFNKSLVAPWLFLMFASYFIKPIFPFLFPLAAITTAIITSRLLSGNMSAIKMPAVSLAALKKIGLWSYSIYLLHQPLINIYSSVITWAVPDEHRSSLPVFLLLLGTWAVVIPFSVLWYKIFELPGIAFGKRIIRKINARNAAAVEPQRVQEKRGIAAAAFCWRVAALLIIAAGSCFISAELTPPAPDENNNLAWSLATNPDASKRNGVLAVKLAENACGRTQYRTTTMVGTLAACYAEAGRFDDAVAAAQKAIELATQNGETNLLKRNQELMELYRAHQPYREQQTNTQVEIAPSSAQK